MTTLEKEKPNLTQPSFVWVSEHQKAFDTLKVALTTAPVLGYPNFKKEFILETDASIGGLGAVLSQVDYTSKVHVIAYASWTLRPSEQSMHKYSSAKLQLLAFKWAVTKKLRDYLLQLKFTVYTDNKPLAYVQTGKLGDSLICWLSELARFDFNIIYRLDRTNKATDALSQCPVEPNCKLGSESHTNSKDPVVLLYATIYDIIKPGLGDTKIPFVLEKEAQAISNTLEEEISANVPRLHEVPDLTVETSAVSVFNQVSQATMAKAQTKDSVLGLVIPYTYKGGTKGLGYF